MPHLQTCSGAVACQIFDCLHPGSINMAKVGDQRWMHVAVSTGGSSRGVGREQAAAISLQTSCTAGTRPPNQAQVDFNYRNEVDYLKNYKELQKAFDSVSCPKACACWVLGTLLLGAGGLPRPAASVAAWPARLAAQGACSASHSCPARLALVGSLPPGWLAAQPAVCGCAAGVPPHGAEQGQAAGQQRVHAGGRRVPTSSGLRGAARHSSLASC